MLWVCFTLLGIFYSPLHTFSYTLIRYNVEFFSPEEEALYGLHGIKLKPVDEAKRTWLFRADNEDEQNQWAEVVFSSILCNRKKLTEMCIGDIAVGVHECL